MRSHSLISYQFMITKALWLPTLISSLDALLCLDGEIFFIDPSGGYWVKFEVKRTKVSQARPHGLRYSLTLHDKDGTRLVRIRQCAFGYVGIGARGKARSRV